MELRFFDFKVNEDERGKLTFLEANRDVPFSIKRIYYIYGVGENVARGFHSHKNLEQCLICMHGSVKVKLFDGAEEKTALLDDCSKGLYVGNNIWREMFDFSPDAVLMVLASEYFDESDYIRSFDDFMSGVRK